VEGYMKSGRTDHCHRHLFFRPNTFPPSRVLHGSDMKHKFVFVIDFSIQAEAIKALIYDRGEIVKKLEHG
jgi:hypothetical protein